jgi:hypothetical protein
MHFPKHTGMPLVALAEARDFPLAILPPSLAKFLCVKFGKEPRKLLKTYDQLSESSSSISCSRRDEEHACDLISLRVRGRGHALLGKEICRGREGTLTWQSFCGMKSHFSVHAEI